jgi:hypothetical protein
MKYKDGQLKSVRQVRDILLREEKTSVPAKNLHLYGWLDYIDTPPVFDAETEKRIRGDVEIVDGKAVRQYTVEPLSEDELEARFKATVPDEISKAQGVIILRQMNLFDAVQAWLDDNPNHAEVFELSHKWTRGGQIVNIVATEVLQLSERQVDEIFIQASQITF